jgi:hypothetical protein
MSSNGLLPEFRVNLIRSGKPRVKRHFRQQDQFAFFRPHVSNQSRPVLFQADGIVAEFSDGYFHGIPCCVALNYSVIILVVIRTNPRPITDRNAAFPAFTFSAAFLAFSAFGSVFIEVIQFITNTAVFSGASINVRIFFSIIFHRYLPDLFYRRPAVDRTCVICTLHPAGIPDASQISDYQQSVAPAPSRGLPHTPSSAGGR